MALNEDEVVIAKVEKNSTDEVRVLLRKWRDRWTIDVRVYFPNKSGRMQPSKSGVSLNIEKLPALAGAIQVALDRA